MWHLFPVHNPHDLAEVRREVRSYLSSQAEHNQQLHRAETGTQPPLSGSRNQNTEVFQSTSPLKYLLQYRGKFAWLCSGLPFTDHQQLLQNHSGYSKIETLKEQQFISQYDQAGRRLIHLYFMQVKHTTSPTNSLSALLQPQSDQMDKTTLETIVFWQPKGKGKQNAQHC